MWKALGRGFDSRRLHLLFLLPALLLTCRLSAQESPLTIFEGARKSQISVQSIEGYPYVQLAALKPFFDFRMTSLAGNQSLSVTLGTHNVILSSNRALVSLDGKLVSLNGPVFVADGEWYVPLDFLNKVLKLISEKRLLWLENSRSLLMGDITPNQLNLRYSMETDHSRLVFQSARPVGFTVSRDRNAIVITPQSEDYLLGFQDTPFRDGVLEELKVEKRTFRIETGEAFADFKVFDLQDPPRLVIDVYRKETAPTTEKPQEPPPPALIPAPAVEKKVIVIDPGHGGSETGATGKEGTYEKDIVLSIARKLKGILEGNSRIQVVLTRVGDEQISLDDRTALANNNKADLFISVHANSTVHGYAKGAETYFLSTKATDDDSRAVAAIENNAIGLNQEASNVDPDLKLILWDMAQTEYLAESSQLAEIIQQELNAALGIANRGIKQAPFRVLMGATMPAVLVEVGFINNPAEERLMMDSEYQGKIARAIFRSIQKFQGITEQAAAELPRKESR